MKTTKIKNPTNKICPLPWHHFYMQNTGTIKLCCAATTGKQPIVDKETNTVTQFIKNNRNHPKVVQARRDWLDGYIPEDCHMCIERDGFKRVDGWNEVLIDQGGLERPETEIVDYPARYLDYRIDATCQAFCIMCVPAESSRWKSVIRNNPQIKPWMPDGSSSINGIKIDHQWLYDIDKVVMLTVAGGEPFISDRNYDFLYDNIHKIKRLRFITNLNDVHENIFNFIEQNKKKIKVTISCDGLYDTYNFVRAGLSWEKLEKNYKRLKTILPSTSILVNFVSMSHNKHQHQQMIDYFAPSEVIIEEVENAPWVDDPEFLEHWYRVNPKARELSKRYDG
tara:strand:- start:2496 stop:3506 length:1011 start_codon:yes stop_codon:yes gene_type:complete